MRLCSKTPATSGISIMGIDDAALDALRKHAQVSALLAELEQLPVYTKPPRPKNEDAARALAELLRVCVEVRQIADATRRTVMQPLEDRRALFTKFFEAELIYPLDVLERHLRAACADYLSRQGEKAQHEQARAIRRLESRSDEMLVKANRLEFDGKPEHARRLREKAAMLMITLPESTTATTRIEGLQTRQRLRWRYTDASMAQLPDWSRALLAPVIEEKVRALGEHALRIIPGITIEPRTSVAVVTPHTTPVAGQTSGDSKT